MTSEPRDEQKRSVATFLQMLARLGVQSIHKPRPAHLQCQTPGGTTGIAGSAGTAEPPQSLQPVTTQAEPTPIDSRTAALPKRFDTAHDIVAEDTMNAKKRRTKRGCAELLHVIEQEVASCTKCPPLAESRTQTVFGVGNPNPTLCFIGEAPGRDEDKQGEPFVGRAGQLLDKILDACNLKRNDVYILNTIKCRPPHNRNPEEKELANCWDYALRQLDVLQPKFICCLGSIAAQTVLQTKQPIGKLRGSFHEFRGMSVLVTYHPAYLLRNPAAKAKVWSDMKMLMREMGRNLD